jgi:hypothetical protein
MYVVPASDTCLRFDATCLCYFATPVETLLEYSGIFNFGHEIFEVQQTGCKLAPVLWLQKSYFSNTLLAISIKGYSENLLIHHPLIPFSRS